MVWFWTLFLENGRVLLDIRLDIGLEIEQLDLDPSILWLGFDSAWVTELWYSPRQWTSCQDPDLPKICIFMIELLAFIHPNNFSFFSVILNVSTLSAANKFTQPFSPQRITIANYHLKWSKSKTATTKIPSFDIRAKVWAATTATPWPGKNFNWFLHALADNLYCIVFV